MAALVKTKNVAEVLQVAPKTVQSWVRKYKIPVTTNDRGHYLYDTLAIERLQTVKSTQMPDEKDTYIEQNHTSATSEAEKRMDDILRRLDHLEKMIEEKADEVVSFQLLKHREELDDVQVSLAEIERQINHLRVVPEDDREAPRPQKKRKKLVNTFLFSS